MRHDNRKYLSEEGAPACCIQSDQKLTFPLCSRKIFIPVLSEGFKLGLVVAQSFGMNKARGRGLNKAIKERPNIVLVSTLPREFPFIAFQMLNPIYLIFIVPRKLILYTLVILDSFW